MSKLPDIVTEDTEYEGPRKTVKRTWTLDEISDIFSMGDGSLVSALVARLRAAEQRIGELEEESRDPSPPKLGGQVAVAERKGMDLAETICDAIEGFAKECILKKE